MRKTPQGPGLNKELPQFQPKIAVSQITGQRINVKNPTWGLEARRAEEYRNATVQRDHTGKLTEESKYEIEKVAAEVVRRSDDNLNSSVRQQQIKQKLKENEEKYVSLESDAVLRKKPKGKLQWLIKACNAMDENRLQEKGITKCFEIIAAPTFCGPELGGLSSVQQSGDNTNSNFQNQMSQSFTNASSSSTAQAVQMQQEGNLNNNSNNGPKTKEELEKQNRWHHSQSKKAFDMLQSRLHFFTTNQQRYLNCDRFPFHKLHAIVEILDTDEEEEQQQQKKKQQEEEERRRIGSFSSGFYQKQKKIKTEEDYIGKNNNNSNTGGSGSTSMPKWLLRKKRRDIGLPSDSEEMEEKEIELSQMIEKGERKVTREMVLKVGLEIQEEKEKERERKRKEAYKQQSLQGSNTNTDQDLTVEDMEQRLAKLKGELIEKKNKGITEYAKTGGGGVIIKEKKKKKEFEEDLDGNHLNKNYRDNSDSDFNDNSTSQNNKNKRRRLMGYDSDDKDQELQHQKLTYKKDHRDRNRRNDSRDRIYIGPGKSSTDVASGRKRKDTNHNQGSNRDSRNQDHRSELKSRHRKDTGDNHIKGNLNRSNGTNKKKKDSSSSSSSSDSSNSDNSDSSSSSSSSDSDSNVDESESSESKSNSQFKDSDDERDKIAKKREEEARKDKTERRIDPSDGQMYDLKEFVDVYGGSLENPPHLWNQQKHTAFWFKN